MASIKYTLAIIALCLFELTQAHLRRDPHNPVGLAGEEATYGTPKIFSNRIDHFDESNTNTYAQRYWVNDTFYDGEGPVFLYICGEWTCRATNPDTNAAFKMGQKHHALLLTLEHRFYGESQPFDDAAGGWSHQNLKYLNTTQALADIASFIEYYKAHQMTVATDNWLIIGGSYPGALVAWFKNNYPDHVRAAWSSSGVINAIEDFTDFDMDIYLQAQKNLGGCQKEIAMVTDDIERALLWNSTSDVHALYDKFGNSNYDIDHRDFMWFISDIFTMGVQYGNRTYLCHIMEHEWFDIAPIQIIANLAKDAFRVHPEDYDADKLTNTTVDFNKNARQWSWQYCTEFGWFQEPNMLYPQRSLSMNHDFWINYCKRMFSLQLQPPAVDYAHSYYGDNNMVANNIFFLNSAEDPWQYAGMRYIPDPDNSQKNLRAHYIDCEDCGHCSDLHVKDDNDQAVLEAQQTATAQIEKWMGLPSSN